MTGGYHHHRTDPNALTEQDYLRGAQSHLRGLSLQQAECLGDAAVPHMEVDRSVLEDYLARHKLGALAVNVVPERVEVDMVVEALRVQGGEFSYPG